MFFLCVYGTIFQCLSMCTYACTSWCMYHTNANMCIIKKVGIYVHLNIFIWTKISFNTYLTHATLLTKVFFQLSWIEKVMPYSESLEPIHLDGVKKQNMFSFKASIGLLHLFQLSKKNKPCSKSLEQICLDEVKKWNKAYSFKVSIGLLPFFLMVTKVSPLLKVWSRFV